MYGIVLLIVVALVSLLITRVATIALTVTGLARGAARFQARSALSGVGFTTSEAESVVSHPVRRRIIMALMLIGNVGFVTAVAGLLGGLVSTREPSDAMLRGVVLVGGLGVVYALSLSKRVDRWLSRHIARLLRRFTKLDIRDYASLLHVSGEYAVKELMAEPEGWLAERSLGELRLRDEGVIVLGIVRRDGSYIGAPGKKTCIRGGDTVILYGRSSVVAQLGRRQAGPGGEEEHQERVEQHKRVEAREQLQDPATPAGAKEGGARQH